MCTGNFWGGGEGAPRPHLPRKRAPFSAKTPSRGKNHVFRVALSDRMSSAPNRSHTKESVNTRSRLF